MPELPRLNGVIKVLEEGGTAFVGFTPVEPVVPYLCTNIGMFTRWR